MDRGTRGPTARRRRGEEPIDVGGRDARRGRPGASRSRFVRRASSARRPRSTKSHVRRPARQGLDADRAAARVEVEDSRIGNALAEDREQRLLDPIGDRARAAVARRDRAAGRRPTPAMTRIRPRRPLRGGGEVALEPRQRAAGVPATGRPRRSRRPARAPARASARCRGSNREATRSGGSPDWRVPSRLPAPRSARSASAMREAVVRAAHDLEPALREVDRSRPRAGCRRSDAFRGRPARGAGGAAPGRSARRPRSRITLALGTSIPTSITVVATSTSISPAAKAVIVASRDVGAAAGRGRCRCAAVGSAARSRSASASALAACSASDSATSGTTTKDWRPSAASVARNASIFGTRPRSRISVRIGWRPGGSSRIVLIDRSPYTVRASVRGIGRGGQRQHVRLAAAALRLERGALPDAEAVLLVDDRPGRAAGTRPPR